MGDRRTLMLISLQVRISIKNHLFAFANHLQQPLAWIDDPPTMISFVRVSVCSVLIPMVYGWSVRCSSFCMLLAMSLMAALHTSR